MITVVDIQIVIVEYEVTMPSQHFKTERGKGIGLEIGSVTKGFEG